VKMFATANPSFGGSILQTPRHVRAHATHTDKTNVHDDNVSDVHQIRQTTRKIHWIQF